MLNLTLPNYKFCPFCGSKLSEQIEEEKKRKHCNSCNWTYYPHVGTAAIAVIIKNEQVLLVKRNKEPYKNQWMFPAGFIDYGEHPEEAIKREVFEETGLKTIKTKLLAILQTTDDPRSMGHFSIFYKAEVKAGTLQPHDIQENNDIRWFDINAAPKVCWITHRKIMKLIQMGKIK